MLTRRGLLALEAVVDVAIHARPDPVQARDITERQGVPQRYLEQIMQALVRANILRGVRGPRGGYRLARERRRIHLDEIVSAVSALDKDAPETGLRSDLGRTVLSPLCAELDAVYHARLSATTIEDLCRQVESAPTSDTDFTI